MTRVGRDSTVAADVPMLDLSVAMGYGNGAFAWSQADWARFTKAGIATARIDVDASSRVAAASSMWSRGTRPRRRRRGG